jgi:hypothetical protein
MPYEVFSPLGAAVAIRVLPTFDAAHLAGIRACGALVYEMSVAAGTAGYYLPNPASSAAILMRSAPSLSVPLPPPYNGVARTEGAGKRPLFVLCFLLSRASKTPLLFQEGLGLCPRALPSPSNDGTICVVTGACGIPGRGLVRCWRVVQEVG